MAILDNQLVCYSCQFYSFRCSSYEQQCRIIELVLSVLYFIGLVISLFYVNRFRNLNSVLDKTTDREGVYVKRKLFFCITSILTFLICGIRCLLLSLYSTANASMNIYILVLACTYLIDLIMGVQFNSILLFWIELIILRQTHGRYSANLEIAKKNYCLFCNCHYYFYCSNSNSIILRFNYWLITTKYLLCVTMYLLGVNIHCFIINWN